ncbi:MAG TPA: isocitrate lyase/phosphoenolpyruvate mutase family protein [Pseudonocardia sp.]|jgi:2-methylisocitrate lyase-like PEP mutase family enzyme|uniref:isocitrate lyase/phosphoenolpyruvate mutase family protein n=1 Tax=Pseudonocardia sp. TaxID=60912 RepID=UPI002B4AF9F7|nr:isocitrate lyase/phosphoenolpyruvate mutase family protein [Pseudonocardia sp.]HLU58588.1 isocitrate lyase/phosphoenolpyruvate mutase family protein [Pseudonocardia sp.]
MRPTARPADPPSGLRSAFTSGPVVVPGCHDPLSARLAAEAGAAVVFLAGSAVGRALFDQPSVPRYGAPTYLRYVELVCRASPVPVIVDGEDGFGDTVRTCARLAAAGAAGVIVGDSRPDGGLRPAEAFAAEIAEARRTGLQLVVARADGIAADRPGTLARVARYRAAGADLTLPLLTSVLRTESHAEQLATFAPLAGAAAGTLALHARRIDQLPPLSRLPAGIAAVFVTGISVPTSTDHITRVLSARRGR